MFLAKKASLLNIVVKNYAGTKCHATFVFSSSFRKKDLFTI